MRVARRMLPVLVVAALGFQAAPAAAALPTQAGAVTTAAGSGTAVTSAGTGSAAGLNAPSAVVVAGGIAYTATADAITASTISSGATTVLAGTPGTPGCADGVGGAGSTVRNATALATDGSSLFGVGACGLRRTIIATGATSTIAATTSLRSIAFAGDGTLYGTNGTQLVRVDLTTGAVTGVNVDVGPDINGRSTGGVASDGPTVYFQVLDNSNLDNSINRRIVAYTPGTGASSILVTDDNMLMGPLAASGGFVYASRKTTGCTGNSCASTTPQCDGDFSGCLIDRPRLVAVPTTGGSFTGLAGAGTGFSEGTGTDAWFRDIAGLASDGSSVFVADTGNNRLRRVAGVAPLPTGQPAWTGTASTVALGQVRTFAGNGTATTSPGVGTGAGLNRASAVTYAGGYAYVGTADAIVKISTADGTATILAGAPGQRSIVNADTGAASRIGSVSDLVNDGRYLYFLDGGMIRRTSLQTGATSLVGALNASYSLFSGLAIGPDGTLYAINRSLGVSAINPISGAVTGFTTFTEPYGCAGYTDDITADATFLYVTEVYEGCLSGPKNLRIFKVSLADKTTTSLPVDPSGYKMGAALTAAGDSLYVGYQPVNTSGATDVTLPWRLVRVPKAGGTASLVAGSALSGNQDGVGSAAGFADISGLASDGIRLLVADAAGNTLRTVQAAPNPPRPQGGPVNVNELVGGSNPAEPQTTCNCADPINTATGAFFETNSDLAIPGRGVPLSASRTYDSSIGGQNGPLGFGWTTGYSARLVVDPSVPPAALDAAAAVDVVQENGSQVTFTKNSSGGYDPPTRAQATLARNADGTWTFTRRAQLTMTFDASGKLTAEKDLHGYTTAIGYDASGRLATVTDPAGRKLTYGYDAANRIASVTGPLNRTVTYGYDPAGNLASVTDANGGITKYGYDTAHRLTSVVDPRGKPATTNQYGPDGRIARQTDALNHATTFTWRGAGPTGSWSVDVTDRRGYVSTLNYTDSRLTSKTAAAGTPSAATTNYNYDPVTNEVARTKDPLGRTSSFTYDAAGNQLSATDPLNRITKATYDTLGNVLTSTDATGVVTTNTYTATGDLKTSSTPLAGTASVRTATLGYGDAARPGDVTSRTDPNGKVWTYAYNTQGDLVSSTDPLGNKTTAVFDAAGQRTSMTSPRGNVAGATPAQFTTSYTYNGYGQMLTSTDPLGHVSKAGYDNNGNQTSSTDPLNRITSTAYDDLNRPTTTTRPDATTEVTGYDGEGNRTSSTNGAGKTTTYTYDPLGQPASTTDPLNRTTSTNYDTAGNLTKKTLPDGKVTSYTYDAADQLKTIGYSDTATPGVTYGYDNNGRRTSMVDGTGTSSYTIDSLGRLTSNTNGAGSKVSYGYDLAGNVISLTYPNGKKVTRGYDDAGRYTSLTDWLGKTTSFGYDPDSNLTSSTYPNTMVGTATYDRDGRLATLQHKAGATVRATFNPTVDNADQTTALTTSGTAQTNSSYGYNALGQLTTANTKPLTYDGAGNLTKLDNGTTQSYDDAGQLTSTLSATGTRTIYSHDTRGNTTAWSSGGMNLNRFSYDQENRLVAQADTYVTYKYDGDGVRTQKASSGKTASFSYDMSGGLPLVLDDATNTYLYGPGGQPVEQISASGAASFLQADQHGSTRLITDAAGTTVGSYTYSPYGAPTYTGTVTTTLQYSGQYTDSENGLQYLRARYYNPANGNFLTRDPIENTTGQPYSYAGGNPIDNSDPSGLCWFGKNPNGSCRGSGAGGAITSGVVNFGRTVSFGLSDKIANAISPGASCTVTRSGAAAWIGKGGGYLAIGLVTGGAGDAAAAAKASQTSQLLRGLLLKRAGFSGTGSRVIVDENLPSAWAAGLRAAGYDARSISEMGISGSTDAQIGQLAQQIGARVITRDVGHDIGGGFPGGVIVDSRIRQLDSLLRILGG